MFAKKSIWMVAMLLVGTTSMAQLNVEAHYRNAAGFAQSVEAGVSYQTRNSVFVCARAFQSTDFGLSSPDVVTQGVSLGIGYDREVLSKLHVGLEVNARINDALSGKDQDFMFVPGVYAGYDFRAFEFQIGSSYPYFMSTGIKVPFAR